MITTAHMTSASIDRAFRIATAHTGSGSYEVAMARTLMDLGAVAASPANVTAALGAAARLVSADMTIGQVQRLYPHGGVTHTLVTEAVVAAG